MKGALASYGRVLRRAARSASTPVDLVGSGSGATVMRLDASHWYAYPRPGDEALLSACTAATLDVGCGPGRLVKALARKGISALGIDISPEAVRQARRRGATVNLVDVFGDVPGVGRWGHVLLADGNIGIGGDPVRLLRRCRSLLAPSASVVAEFGRPGSETWSRPVRLRHRGEVSAAFWWAAVSVDDLAGLASEAGLRVLSVWNGQGRWFASLTSD
jgi:SAM-dependent methyltransferase